MAEIRSNLREGEGILRGESDPRPGHFWLMRVWAASLLALLVATWRLWTGTADYPAVPMMSLPTAVGHWVSLASFAGILIACVCIAVWPRRLCRGWWLISACLVGSFVCDQQRLQPWAYQAAILGIMFATMSPSLARRWMIWFEASIYVYSAIGKFDFQFAHTVGQDFLRPLLTLSGLSEQLSESQKVSLALIFPAIELIAGVGVLVHRTRRTAGLLIIAMHVELVLLLGPLGFNHSRGVLLWNVLLAMTAWQLFVRDSGKTGDAVDDAERGFSAGRRVVQLVVAVVILMPLAERGGYWDHWPSWALYSPHNSRIKMQVHSSLADAFPASLNLNVQGHEGWIDVDLDAWSLASRGVPIYPQARYQLALATELTKRTRPEHGVRVIVQGVADRWTGTRDEKFALGLAEMQRLGGDYWLMPVR